MTRTNDDEKDVVIELPLVLRASRRFFVFFLVFFALLTLILLYGSVVIANVWFIVATVFFALITGSFVRLLRNPRNLIVSEKGFALSNTGFFRKENPDVIPWIDVEGFGVFNQGFKYVSYQFTKASGRRRLPGGYVIPVVFEVPGEEVAMLLEGIRQGSLQHEISGVVIQE